MSSPTDGIGMGAVLVWRTFARSYVLPANHSAGTVYAFILL